jgi:hypothetical protein
MPNFDIISAKRGANDMIFGITVVIIVFLAVLAGRVIKWDDIWEFLIKSVSCKKKE